jgi:transcriptional regulator with XRE-family HTH domain
MDIGKNLKQIRIENNYTQQQIADVLKISRISYGRYENNQREISIFYLKKLAEFYNVTLDYICN